jgi:hypothetical protein
VGGQGEHVHHLLWVQLPGTAVMPAVTGQAVTDTPTTDIQEG